ncbi:MAG: ComEA family DNA-binding protein [Ruminococcaceae bacterium]|nr:ComEA family DNA-binding protein [Oscillospiraceae bacterium]
MDNNKNSKEQFSDSVQKAFVLTVMVIALIFIMAFTMFKDSADVNIYSITVEKTVYNTVPDSDKLNINTASKEELMKLDGIGDTISERIIDYRDEHGAFSSIEEIKNVKGITETVYKRIEQYIKIKEP